MTDFLERLKAKFSELDEMFRARAFRERALLGGMAAGFIFFALDTSVIQPIRQERSRISRGSDAAVSNIEQVEQEIKSLSSTELTPAEQRTASEIERLRTQLAEIDSRMRSELGALIPPTAVVALLEEVLAEELDLKLIRLESQAPIRIGSNQDSGATESDLGLYRHGLRIEIEGNFHATLRYLQRLERSKWSLLWDRFEYRVQKFPTATITIDLHTLSEREEWIGV